MNVTGISNEELKSLTFVLYNKQLAYLNQDGHKAAQRGVAV